MAGPLRLEAPGAADPTVRGVCAAAVTNLPLSFAGKARRLTTPSPETTAAWGEPPITFVCGVPAGSPTDQAYTFDGIRWAMHDIGSARTWTTLDQSVNVVVTIPDQYDGQAELLGSIAAALTPTANTG